MSIFWSLGQLRGVCGFFSSVPTWSLSGLYMGGTNYFETGMILQVQSVQYDLHF